MRSKHDLTSIISTLVLACTLTNVPVRAQSDGQCGGVGAVPVTDTIGVARVTKGQPRLHFSHDRGSEAGRGACPAQTPACRAAAFLVPGDVVLALTGQYNGHVCAAFVNRSGRETYGWLPAAAVQTVAEKPTGEKDWVGTWLRTEATIRITTGKRGLHVTGEATYGAGDKRRVDSGAVNTGEFDGAARRAGDVAFVADQDIASFEAAPGDRCVVRMRRVGPYLLVEDNTSCGGMNVTFTGLYVRR